MKTAPGCGQEGNSFTTAGLAVRSYKGGLRYDAYGIGHPWYYFLGGIPHPVEALKAREVSLANSKLKPAQVKGAIAAIRANLRREVERYRELMAMGVSGRQAMCWERNAGERKLGWCGSMSLLVAHITYAKGELRLLAKRNGYKVPPFDEEISETPRVKTRKNDKQTTMIAKADSISKNRDKKRASIQKAIAAAQKKRAGAGEVPTPASSPHNGADYDRDEEQEQEPLRVEVRELPVKQLRRSPFNREIARNAKFLELVESVRTHGIIQPLVVRTIPKRAAVNWEIVAGERRWLAAQECGLDTVPCRIKEMTDREALEIQAVENLDREDLNPMDEARKYQQLLDLPGYTMADLQAATGKGKSAVYARLKLLSLVPDAMNAVEDGRLPASHAELIGSIEVPELQRELLKEILDCDSFAEGDTKGLMSFRRAREAASRKTKEMENLQTWRETRESFLEKGFQVLSDEESENVLTGRQVIYSCREYVSAEGWCRDIEDESDVWKEVIAKYPDAKWPDPVLAKAYDQSPVTLYPTDAIIEAAKAAGVKFRDPDEKSEENEREDAERKAKYDQRLTIFERVTSELIASPINRMLRLMIFREADMLSHSELGICDDETSREEFEKMVLKADGKQLQKWLTKIALDGFAPKEWGGEWPSAPLASVCDPSWLEEAKPIQTSGKKK